MTLDNQRAKAHHRYMTIYAAIMLSTAVIAAVMLTGALGALNR